MASAVKAAILGPGNIGADLMLKLRRVEHIELAMMVGIYEDSPGLARAQALGIETSAMGVEAVLGRDDIALVFDATSAQAHLENAPKLQHAGKTVVDLTPAALGPFVVPSVNLEQHIDDWNVNLVSCGGQATIPFLHAIDRVADVDYGEIVATIASKSAGQGTRQNIDEFTVTTAQGLEVVGGAERGKAIIILNPAEPPILMRDTIFARVREPKPRAIDESIREITEDICQHVPGLRLLLVDVDGDKVTVMVEIKGAGDFLPTYAGNLDIMTAAAARVGGEVAKRMLAGRVPA
jgi:acetaldehyde dehydrogenase (acetylating)